MQDPAIVVRHLVYRIGRGEGTATLLQNVSFVVPRGSFAAIIGSSGCGKTTLLRALAGLIEPTGGEVLLLGHPLTEYRKQFPLALGYLPQVSVAHEDLTVMEILWFAAKLQLPATVDEAMREKWLTYLVELAGLGEVAHQRYKTLSGGQRRRVALAETLVSDPPILLVDELTSGLDPQAEASMMQWLQFLAHKAGKTILLVTHAVRNLDLADTVIFMKRGRVVFHGNHETLRETTAFDRIEDLFQKDEMQIVDEVSSVAPAETVEVNVSPQPIATGGPPPAARQFFTLLDRQFTLLGRDRAHLLLHVVLLITFPAFVAVFAIGGLPQVRNLSLELDMNILRSLQEQLLYLKDSLSAASLVSGLIMFQVILLTLAGANNGSREIAKEGDILDKELRIGLSAGAYASSKFVVVTLFTLVQSFWMTWFVKSICKFPGDFGAQFAVLFLTNLAMGATCLAISARVSTTEKASLLAIYLVGLQLPLSGAVLALPEWLVWFTRPFIAAYWGWSGYLKSLADFRIYDIVRQTTHTWLAPQELAVAVLVVHIILAYAVCAFLVGHHTRTRF